MTGLRAPSADRADDVVDTSDRSAERRRICLVTETYPPEINGVAMTVARLASGLRARGHEVSVVCPRSPATRAGSSECEGTRVPGVALPWYRELRAGLPA